MGKHLINIERTHLMNPSMNVVLKAEFAGEFKEDVFYKAVEELQNAYEALTATVQMDEDGKAYLVTSTSQAIPVIILEAGTPFEKLVVSENSKRFKLDKECLMRIYVIPLLNTFSVIMISHHLLGDGKSSIMLMEALGKAYVGESLKNVGIRLIKDSTELGSRSKMSLASRLYLNILNKNWRKMKKIFTGDNYKTLFRQYQKEYASEVFTLSLNAVEFRRFHYSCKEKKVTINSAVVAAFIYAQKELNVRHTEHIDRVGIAVDIREQLSFESSELIGNYASVVSIRQGEIPAIPFEKFVGQIHKRLQKKLNTPADRMLGLQVLDKLDDSLVDAVYFTQYTDSYQNKAAQTCAKIFGYERQPHGLGITNLGNVSKSIATSTNLESLLFIPPAAPCNDMTIGVVTYQGVMQIGISYQVSCMNFELMKRICKRAKELLVNY